MPSTSITSGETTLLSGESSVRPRRLMKSHRHSSPFLGSQKKKVNKAVAESKEKDIAAVQASLELSPEALKEIHEMASKPPIPAATEERHQYFIDTVGRAEGLLAGGETQRHPIFATIILISLFRWAIRSRRCYSLLSGHACIPVAYGAHRYLPKDRSRANSHGKSPLFLGFSCAE